MAHWSDGVPDKAVLTRSASDVYRSNCYSATKPRAAVWKNTSVIQAHLKKIGRQPRGTAKYKAASTGHANVYKFGYRQNFKTQAPWPNQAHHMLPCEAFKLGEVFNLKEHKILKKVDYDLNNGKNLIYLPKYEKDRGYTDVLPDHLGSHASYTDDVMQAMKDLKTLIGKYVKGDCEEQDPPTDIKNEILDLQDDFWDDFTGGTYKGMKLT